MGTSAGQRALACNTAPLLSRPHASSPSSARTRRRAIRGTVGTDRLLADRYSWGTLLGPSREDPPWRRRLAALTRSIASITFSACARTRIVGAAALRLCEPARRALDSRLRLSRSGHYRSPLLCGVVRRCGNPILLHVVVSVSRSCGCPFECRDDIARGRAGYRSEEGNRSATYDADRVGSDSRVSHHALVYPVAIL